MLHRYLARACASHPRHVVRAGRILAWSGWAAILFGVVRKSAAPSALAQFPLTLPAWWIPQDAAGFLFAAATLLAGLTVWAAGKKLEHLDKAN
ncbi:MAG TPA: hypothetical protein VL528_11735 [Oxalicibacterium sp.]|jgi:hypothetical protein|nr:hypothetical protein [Oxalicibacterium sp.]